MPWPRGRMLAGCVQAGTGTGRAKAWGAASAEALGPGRKAEPSVAGMELGLGEDGRSPKAAGPLLSRRIPTVGGARTTPQPVRAPLCVSYCVACVSMHTGHAVPMAAAASRSVALSPQPCARPLRCA